jgi:hypothetical protein
VHASNCNLFKNLPHLIVSQCAASQTMVPRALVGSSMALLFTTSVGVTLRKKTVPCDAGCSAPTALRYLYVGAPSNQGHLPGRVCSVPPLSPPSLSILETVFSFSLPRLKAMINMSNPGEQARGDTVTDALDQNPNPEGPQAPSPLSLNLQV